MKFTEGGSILVRRLLLEAVVIVGSILLAFAIDAWWNARAHAADVREQRSALRAQIDANQTLLTQAAIGADQSLSALQRLIRIIGPSTPIISFDTFAVLMNAGFSPANLREPELGALETLLNTGSYRLSLDRELHDQLVRYRSRAQRYSFTMAQYYDIRERSIDVLRTVAPLATVSHFTGAHEPSDFRVAPETVLRNPLVEGIVANLAVKTNNVRTGARALLAQSDSVLQLLRR